VTDLSRQEDLDDVIHTLSQVDRNLAMVQQLLLLCGLRSEALNAVYIHEQLLDLVHRVQTSKKEISHD
jgi:hypothetical protein